MPESQAALCDDHTHTHTRDAAYRAGRPAIVARTMGSDERASRCPPEDRQLAQGVEQKAVAIGSSILIVLCVSVGGGGGGRGGVASVASQSPGAL